jgi:hypothetical protein
MEKCYGAPTKEYKGQPISPCILEKHKAQMDAFVKENAEYFAGRPMYSYLSKEHRAQIDALTTATKKSGQ